MHYISYISYYNTLSGQVHVQFQSKNFAEYLKKAFITQDN